jgi:hypothetical protein
MRRDKWQYLYICSREGNQAPSYKVYLHLIPCGVMVAPLILVQKIVVRAHAGKQNGTTPILVIVAFLF